jgi:(E)-4-hydroxy-3-methylbut-2-enyl-diphosphate synthase
MTEQTRPVPTPMGDEAQPIALAAPAPRRSRQARVVWGDRVVTVGGDAPVRCSR